MSQPTAASEIAKEHAELRDLIEAIGSGFADTSDPSKMNDQLCRFAKQLEEHFAGEEADAGFYAQITKKDSRFAPRVEELVQQHEAMLADANKLPTVVSEGRIDEAAAQFKTLREALATHETEENALMQKAYSEDIGSKD